MQFRPCIDIHNGRVKQIVGSSLCDSGSADENFVSSQNADFYAKMYKRDRLFGGHIILLNPTNSEFYEADCEQARLALEAFSDGMQIGGGINADNAKRFVEYGASHVIVTSFVFKDGKISYQNLQQLAKAVGKEKIVLDLSCRKKDGEYYIVTDRWQKFTDVKVNAGSLSELAGFCDEFLVHAVDVEGKVNGIETELAGLLGTLNSVEITYAGGISSQSDIDELDRLSGGKLNFTVGSALDLFGGNLKYAELAKKYGGKA